MGNNKIQLLDITFDRRLINLLQISQYVGFSYTYTRLLMIGKKKNPQAAKKLRDTIVKHYSNVIQFPKN